MKKPALREDTKTLVIFELRTALKELADQTERYSSQICEATKDAHFDNWTELGFDTALKSSYDRARQVLKATQPEPDLLKEAKCSH